jgi:hypothetical protein
MIWTNYKITASWRLKAQWGHLLFDTGNEILIKSLVNSVAGGAISDTNCLQVKDDNSFRKKHVRLQPREYKYKYFR